jgi:membrane-bound lytic murein transglycosylase D
MLAPSGTYENMPSSPTLSFLPALTDTVDSTEASAAGTPVSLPTPLHFKVQDFIEYFQTDGRETLQGWVNNSAPYAVLMKNIFKEQHLPEDLFYVAMIESGFKLHSVSPAEATGPWQFLSGTARQYGLRIDGWVDERKDPVKSTLAAAEHFKHLYSRFGSWPLALASYNWGADNVQRAIRESRSRDFWNLHASGSIPRELRDYVPKYMAVTIIASNLPAHGFTLPVAEPFVYDEVQITKSTSLHVIAKNANTTYEQIKWLNPELKYDKTPPDTKPYTLRIPKGAKQTYLDRSSAPGQEQDARKNRATAT